MSFGSSLGADDGEPKRVVGDAHDEPVDRRRSGPNVLGAQRKPLCVGGNEAVSRTMTRPDADATADGRARAAMRRTGHGHGAEWETRRQMAETGEGLHLILGWNGFGKHGVLDALQA